MTHVCHAHGCTNPIEPRLAMCRSHWARVPADVKREVWTHYRPGQERSKRPSALYLSAIHKAIAAVARVEGFTDSARYHESMARLYAQQCMGSVR